MRLIKVLNNIDIDIKKYKFIFRPHPIAIFGQKDFNFPILIDFNSNINDKLILSDLLITTHLTSASFDGFYNSIPLLMMAHKSGLNLSPLKVENLMNSIIQRNFQI